MREDIANLHRVIIDADMAEGNDTALTSYVMLYATFYSTRLDQMSHMIRLSQITGNVKLCQRHSDETSSNVETHQTSPELSYNDKTPDNKEKVWQQAWQLCFDCSIK